MPRKKHRLSGPYEPFTTEDAIGDPVQDALATSPVEIAYRTDVEGPFTWPSSGDEQAASADGDHWNDEVASAEECPMVEKAKPIEAYRCVEEEPPAVDCSVVEEVPAAEEEPVVEDEFSDANSQADADSEEVQDDVKELVIICTSCTIMLFTDYEGPCPFSIISSSEPEHESYSWLLHTTCSSCLSKHSEHWKSREAFGNQCKAAFETALLSEEFMKGTCWFNAADRVCHKPLRVLLCQGRRSAAYMKIDDFRQQSTTQCRMRVLKPLRSDSLKSRTIEVLESFMPGGFL